MCDSCINPSKQGVNPDDYIGFQTYCKLYGHFQQCTYEEFIDAYIGFYSDEQEFMLKYRPDIPEDLVPYMNIKEFMKDNDFVMIDGYVFSMNI